MADKKPLSRMNRIEYLVSRLEEMLVDMKEIHKKVDQLTLDADVYKRHYKMWDKDKRKND